MTRDFATEAAASAACAVVMGAVSVMVLGLPIEAVLVMAAFFWLFLLCAQASLHLGVGLLSAWRIPRHAEGLSVCCSFAMTLVATSLLPYMDGPFLWSLVTAVVVTLVSWGTHRTIVALRDWSTVTVGPRKSSPGAASIDGSSSLD